MGRMVSFPLLLVILLLDTASSFELVPEFHIMRQDSETSENEFTERQNIRASLIMIGASTVAAIAASMHDEWVPPIPSPPTSSVFFDIA